MIRPSDIRLDIRDFGKEFFLTNIRENLKYENGKKTEEKIGTKYEVAIPALGLEKIYVKIEGPQSLPDSLILEKRIIKVVFEGLKAHFYFMNERAGISATATGIKIIE